MLWENGVAVYFAFSFLVPFCCLLMMLVAIFSFPFSSDFEIS